MIVFAPFANIHYTLRVSKEISVYGKLCGVTEKTLGQWEKNPGSLHQLHIWPPLGHFLMGNSQGIHWAKFILESKLHD